MTSNIPRTRDRKRILICDDESRTRQALKALLLTREVTCNKDTSSEILVIGEARDGYEAVELVETLMPDVVVIDVFMPRMDGLKATRLIKNNWPDVRVIMLTMYPDQRVAALAAGADVFLVKGCRGETLIEGILG